MWLYPIEGDIDKIREYSTPQKWHSENTVHNVLLLPLSDTSPTLEYVDTVIVSLARLSLGG